MNHSIANRRATPRRLPVPTAAPECEFGAQHFIRQSRTSSRRCAGLESRSLSAWSGCFSVSRATHINAARARPAPSRRRARCRRGAVGQRFDCTIFCASRDSSSASVVSCGVSSINLTTIARRRPQSAAANSAPDCQVLFGALRVRFDRRSSRRYASAHVCEDRGDHRAFVVASHSRHYRRRRPAVDSLPRFGTDSAGTSRDRSAPLTVSTTLSP